MKKHLRKKLKKPDVKNDLRSFYHITIKIITIIFLKKHLKFLKDGTIDIAKCSRKKLKHNFWCKKHPSGIRK